MSKTPSTGSALRRAAPALVICLLGIGMRLWLARNFPAGVDLASYDSVVGILRAGRPLYESTHLYNYSPLWSWTLLGLRNAAEHLGIAPEFLIRIFLTIGDIACAALLFRLARRRGAASPWTVSALFLGNPVLIWIGASQGQFDVLVVSFLLFAILATPEEPRGGRRAAGEWIPMLLLGLSMAWKQVTVFHPLLWRKRIRRPLLLVAYAVPAMAFLPYARQWRAIVRNVLLYRSVPASYGFSELVLFDRRWAAPVAAAALAGAAACAFTGAGRDLARGSLRIFLVLLLLTPGIGGQYLFWPLALGCLFPSAGLWMTTAAASLWIAGDRLAIAGTARFGGHLVWLAIAFWLVRELAAAGIWPPRADPAKRGPEGPVARLVPRDSKNAPLETGQAR